MTFQFGAAASLYQKNIHPRVMVGPADIARLRKLIKGPASSDAVKIMKGLRRKVAPLIDRIHTIDNLPEVLSQWNARWDLPGTTIVWGLHDIAMVGAIDRDQRVIDAAKKTIAALIGADAILGRDGKNIGYGMAPYTTLAYDVVHEWMTPAERLAFVRWSREMFVDFTLKHQTANYMRSSGANIPVGEVHTGFTTLLAIEGDPGAGDLTREKARLLTLVEASINGTIGRDGYPPEDIGYGTGMAGWCAYVAETARRAGLFDPYKDCPRYAKFGQAALHFVQPWGCVLSNTGDHGDDFGERGFILSRLAKETRDPTLLWLRGALYYPSALSGPRDPQKSFFAETDLPGQGHVPTEAQTLITLNEAGKAVHPKDSRVPTQFVDRDRGIVSFRTNWKEDATFVVFDGSQRPTNAQGHQHDSGGHFSLSALGEYFAIDTGRYSIEQDHHNVMLTAGKPGVSTGGDWRMSFYHANLTQYQPGPFVDVASSDTSQMNNAYWAYRTVGLVKGDFPYLWVMDYQNECNDFGEYWWLLNTHPDNRIELRKQSATIHGCKRGNLLDVHFALPWPEEYPKPHKLRLTQNRQRCGSVNYVKDPETDARRYRKLVGDLVHGPVFVRPRLVAKLEGYNGRMLSVLLPREKGAKAARVKQLPSEWHSLALSIVTEKFNDILIWSKEHQILRAGDVDARGDWCVVRRDKRGRFVDYAMGEGTRLTVGGREVWRRL